MHIRNLYKHGMSFTNVFRYLCTISSKQTMPIFLKTKYLLFIGSLVCSSFVVCFQSETYTVKDTKQVPLGDSFPLCSMYTNKEYRFTSQNTTSIMDIYFI